MKEEVDHEKNVVTLTINLNQRKALDGATKNLCNVMYPEEEITDILGKVRGYAYKRFGEESGINFQDISQRVEDALLLEPEQGVSKIQIIERLGLMGAYIDFINWESNRISTEREERKDNSNCSRHSKWATW